MVCIDIKNAFNSIPWCTIREGIDKLDIPSYIKKILKYYLSNRSLIYIDNNGKLIERSVNRGVPQGSVLGPTLWNVGYNPILSMALPVEAVTVCYADDTALLVPGADPRSTAYNASLAVGRVIKKIEDMGLTVAIGKTEVIMFSPGRKRTDKDSYIVIKSNPICVQKQLRYLGLLIDDGDLLHTLIMLHQKQWGP